MLLVRKAALADAENTLDGIRARLDTAGDRISELEDTAKKLSRNTTKKKKIASCVESTKHLRKKECQFYRTIQKIRRTSKNREDF